MTAVGTGRVAEYAIQFAMDNQMYQPHGLIEWCKLQSFSKYEWRAIHFLIRQYLGEAKYGERFIGEPDDVQAWTDFIAWMETERATELTI